MRSRTDGAKQLKVENLTKVFIKGQGPVKSRITAVNNVSLTLDLDHPEIFTLAGESGSGKSTVAKLILGFEEPTSGSIIYEGKDVSKLKGKKDFMKAVQPVFQNPFETFNPLKKVQTYFYETEKNYGMSPAGKYPRSEKALELTMF